MAKHIGKSHMYSMSFKICFTSMSVFFVLLWLKCEVKILTSCWWRKICKHQESYSIIIVLLLRQEWRPANASLLPFVLYIPSRIFLAPIVHFGLLHVALNVLAFTPMAAQLETDLGSLYLAYLLLLFSLIGTTIHLLFAAGAEYGSDLTILVTGCCKCKTVISKDFARMSSTE